MSGKSLRLSHLAKECNTGVSTLIDFLEANGLQGRLRPNTKVESDFIQKAYEKFAPDMARKQASEAVKSQKQEEREMMFGKEEEAPKPEEKKEEEVIKAKAEVSGTKVLGKIDLDKKPAPKPKPKEEEPEEKAAPEPQAKEAKTTEDEKPAETESQKKEEAPADEVERPTLRGTKVLGQIDLDKKPAAKSPEKEEKPSEKTAEKAEETKAEETPKSSEKEAAEGKTEEKQAEGSNVKKTEYAKLDGPKFTGEKVDLSKFAKPKKKKVASSTDRKAGGGRRQRRRISTGGGPGGGGGNEAARRGGNRSRGGRRNEPKKELTEEDIQKQIKETLEKLTGGSKKKSSKLRRERRQERREQEEMRDEQRQEAENRIIQVTEFVTVSELANMMGAPVTEIISACMSLGMMVTMNQRLDGETLTIVAEEFGYEVEFVSADVTEAIEIEQDAEEDLKPRAPIVTVMGHVDHGKTSLLDYIREANVIAGESGGITQHIGAYNVELDGGKHITFLDTPGHEAFTAMRARGAKVTDVAIIVISADDNVMPQTKEAISHAQAAGVPIVFAINKIDRDGADPERIKEGLAQMNLLVEDWGGKIQSHDISAKKGTGVKELLEKVGLEAELLDLKANPDRNASGTVVEASLDKGRGYLATILVQNGTLKIGDYVLAGKYSGKIKAMLDERGHRVKEAGPAQPVSVLGLDGAPTAGDTFVVMEDEREAKAIATKRMQLQREQSARSQKNLTLEEIGRRLAIGDFQELNIIVKGDVDGSIEALSDSLQKLSTDEIQVNIIHKAVGQISESDILLATASDAIIVGFQVRPSANARKLAEKEQVDIRLYSIIYDAINEIRDAMEGMLSPDVKEEIVCNLEVRETFKISKVGTIAGCYVLDGTITRNTDVRLIRDGVVIYTGKLGSLKRFKDDVKEVSKGYECGLNIENFNDIKVGDNIEGFKEVEVKKTLAG